MPTRGVPCDIVDILDKLEAAIAAGLDLPARSVFSTVADEADIPGIAPDQFFVTLHPGILRQRGSAGRPPWAVSPFTIEEPMTTGAGRQVVSVNGSVQIKLWIQFKVDDPGFDSAWLKDRSFGAFRRLRQLLKALHMVFDPTDPSGNFLLQEPFRCHGWASSPHRWADAGKSMLAAYGRLEVDADFSYIQDLT
jgi:hypothetical protein